MAILLQSKEKNEKGKQMPLRFKRIIGRNDPCPCGSKKKYKKCCGEQDTSEHFLLNKLKTTNYGTGI